LPLRHEAVGALLLCHFTPHPHPCRKVEVFFFSEDSGLGRDTGKAREGIEIERERDIYTESNAY
jgi:hypothetical protein